MKRLEYLSGFSIGHILVKILDESREEFTGLEDHLHSNYNQLWSIFYMDVEFVKGLKLGLKIENIPELIQDLVEWFEILMDHIEY